MSKNLTGRTFGYLTAMHQNPPPPGDNPTRTHTAWRCRCDCGKAVVVRTDKLLSGATLSCGCLHRQICRLKGAERAEAVALRKVLTEKIKADSRLYT